MKTKLVASCFVIGTLLAPIVGYTENTPDTSPRRTYTRDSDDTAVVTSSGDASGPRTYVRDSEITTKIKAKLRASTTQIRVDTDSHGVVWLSGTAKNQAEIDRAVSIARHTEGVKSVKEHIKNSTGR